MLAALHDYSLISLEALKARASLLRRIDNKYVLTAKQLSDFLLAQAEDYSVLCIDGMRRFNYSSIYWDGSDYQTFFDHNKGRRRRFKIRFRHYHEAALYFFEIKIKGFRNETVKYRQQTDKANCYSDTLPPALLSFANDKLVHHYGYQLTYTLQRSLRVDYQRTTLVARENSERITIDHGIQFVEPDRHHALAKTAYVVEVKSENGRSNADLWLLRNGHRPLKACSKYGMGINILQFSDRNTRFRSLLRQRF